MSKSAGSGIIATSEAPSAIGPYSQGVRAGDFLFISGQIPLDPRTGRMVEGDIRDKARRVIDNLKAVARAAGGDLARVVKVTVFMKDMNDFAAINEAYAEYFGEILPARSAVQVAALPKGADVEMEAIVHLEAPSRT